MKYFLVKTDPQTYAVDEFEKDQEIIWSGVRNPQAVLYLKQMKPGDMVFIYHSQKETAIVGLARVQGNSRPDPDDKKSWLVDLVFIKKFPTPYITLQQVKKTGKFDNFRLIKQGRLSVMDVPDDVIYYLQQQGLIF